tara:strand:+ start:11249 stop:11665 length:417 start_codon:yes stop_codon:yes gene_type:complete
VKVENSVIPTQEQMAGFLAPGPDGPISMVNLLKFRSKASYEDGRETELTGAEAYAIYSRGVMQTLAKVGGKIVFSGEVSRLMLGEVEELWDSVAIAQYPSRAAMLKMMQLPEYQEISLHRSAGLAGQLNIETANAVIF